MCDEALGRYAGQCIEMMPPFAVKRVTTVIRGAVENAILWFQNDTNSPSPRRQGVRSQCAGGLPSQARNGNGLALVQQYVSRH